MYDCSYDWCFRKIKLRGDIYSMENNQNNLKNELKNSGTFLVKFNTDKKETWQGNVLWAEGNKSEHFRSALELINLIDGVMKGEVEANADIENLFGKAISVDSDMGDVN